MLTIEQLQKKVRLAKREKDVYIMAHSYQPREVCEIADTVGDSFKLSVDAKNAKNKTLLMCGVRFMAETAKLLSPEKRVILCASGAGCPMAEQFTAGEVAAFRSDHPDFAVVCYINTTAALKTVCDVCVTSSSAVEIVRKMDAKNILFIPDINLGTFVKKACPDKNIVLWNGGCPLHGAMTKRDVESAREKYPDALLLAHPECPPEVCDIADHVGSTAGIMNYARNSDAKEFIIGTEISIAETLSYEFPDKVFVPLSKRLICPDMKAATLMDVYRAVVGTGGEEMTFDEDTAKRARGCIDKMIMDG